MISFHAPAPHPHHKKKNHTQYSEIKLTLKVPITTVADDINTFDIHANTLPNIKPDFLRKICEKK